MYILDIIYEEKYYKFVFKEVWTSRRGQALLRHVYKKKCQGVRKKCKKINIYQWMMI